MRSVIEAAGETPGEICLLDTEASPEHLSRGTARYADTLLVVVEPYFKSLETGRRMSALGRDLGVERVALVANKIQNHEELAAVGEFADQHALSIAGTVPFDEQLPAAERASAAPIDFAPDSQAIAAIAAIARQAVTGNGR